MQEYLSCFIRRLIRYFTVYSYNNRFGYKALSLMTGLLGGCCVRVSTLKAWVQSFRLQESFLPACCLPLPHAPVQLQKPSVRHWVKHFKGIRTWGLANRWGNVKQVYPQHSANNRNNIRFCSMLLGSNILYLPKSIGKLPLTSMLGPLQSICSLDSIQTHLFQFHLH